MSGDFIDSNVILSAYDSTDARKQILAGGLIQSALSNGGAWISFQVVQEVLNVVTRRLTPRFSAEDAGRLLAGILAPLWRVMPSQDLYRTALDIQWRYGYSFYDALIIAAALASGCDRLYSEDLQAGQTIENLRIVDPFAEA